MIRATRTSGARAILSLALAASLLGGCARDSDAPQADAAPAEAAPAGEALEDVEPKATDTPAAAVTNSVAEAAQEPAPELPAPPRAIAGLRGLRTRGEVRFASDPSDLHELDTLFVFPDRARAHMVAQARPTLSSWTEMRRGAELHKRDAVGSPPRPLEAEEALGVLLRLERRRALSLYPDGFDWQDGPIRGRGERHVRIDALGPDAPGWLWARLDASGRAIEVGSLTETGDGGSLLATDWHALGERRVPAELEFRWVDETGTFHTIWNETVVSFETEVRYRDEGIFVPGNAEGFRQSVRSDLRVELPAGARAVEALEGDTPGAWRGQLAAAIARIDPDGEHALDTTLRLQLDEHGVPTELLLLAGPGGSAPTGFEPRPARAAFQRLLPERPDDGWQRLDEASRTALAQALAGLRVAAREAGGSATGSAYLRLPAPGSGGSVQLVLPLVN